MFIMKWRDQSPGTMPNYSDFSLSLSLSLHLSVSLAKHFIFPIFQPFIACYSPLCALVGVACKNAKPAINSSANRLRAH